MLTPRRANAGNAGANRRTGTAHIPTHFIKLVPCRLHFFICTANEHNVAGLAMGADQA